MLALSVNIIAFYLGAIYMERSGICSAVAIFFFTSLIGTILASGLERMIGVATQRAFNRIQGSIGRHSDGRPFN
jgi:hypothetical protein